MMSLPLMVAVVCGHCRSGNPQQGESYGYPTKICRARIKRREDPALIQGLGQYVDDIPMPNMLHTAFFRSPYAHARIAGLHVEAARQHPGVVAVLTGHDILDKMGTIPCGAAAPGLKLPVKHALAIGKVGFVGQPVAVCFVRSTES